MTENAKRSTRRGPAPSPQLSRPDVPYTMRLPDGRTLYVEVPGRWTATDRSGEIVFLPEAVEFLDRLRALAAPLDRTPTPGFIVSLREALGLTQVEFAERIGVDSMTVSRWERGQLHPSKQSLEAIEKLRRRATRRGVAIPS